MTVNVQPNNSLTLTLDTATVECQVIDLSFKLPGTSAGTLVLTACPDGAVMDPGSPQVGALTGNAYTDTLDTGLWTLLADAYEVDADLAYVLTFFPEGGPTQGVVFTGTAKVNSLQLDFAKPGNSKHPIDLGIETAVRSRPAAA